MTAFERLGLISPIPVFQNDYIPGSWFRMLQELHCRSISRHAHMVRDSFEGETGVFVRSEANAKPHDFVEMSLKEVQDIEPMESVEILLYQLVLRYAPDARRLRRCSQRPVPSLQRTANLKLDSGIISGAREMTSRDFGAFRFSRGTSSEGGGSRELLLLCVCARDF